MRTQDKQAFTISVANEISSANPPMYSLVEEDEEANSDLSLEMSQ
jgi:hypothetical protein